METISSKICSRSVSITMVDEEVVTLSEDDCQDENADCGNRKDATVAQQKSEAQEIQRLRDRVEELEIEKVILACDWSIQIT